MSEQQVAGRAAPYREVTVAGVLLGVLVGVLMTVSFTYAGLKLGFTVPASMVSAMLGWGVLRGLLKKGSIVENNINQTVAAAINVSSAGVIFTVPVLYLASSEAARSRPDVLAAAAAAHQTVDDYLRLHPGMAQQIPTHFLWAIAASSLAGAVLGVLFIIPSRKQMIDLERLTFPSGVATAAILKASGSGRSGRATSSTASSPRSCSRPSWASPRWSRRSRGPPSKTSTWGASRTSRRGSRWCSVNGGLTSGKLHRACRATSQAEMGIIITPSAGMQTDAQGV